MLALQATYVSPTAALGYAHAGDVEQDAPLATDNPRNRDREACKGIARPVLELVAVVHADRHLTLEDIAGVSGSEPGKQLTLIEAETLKALRAEHGIDLDGANLQRNGLTRGVRLNELVGEHFRVGKLECRGVELCEPCLHLLSLTHPGVIKGLVHRAGLNAEILIRGELRPGDAIAQHRIAHQR